MGYHLLTIDQLHYGVTKITTHYYKDNKRIGRKKDKTATGLFYHNLKNDLLFLITNRHVILDEKSSYFPNAINLLLHTNEHDMSQNTEYSIDLYDGTKPVWRNPKPLEADVVAIPIDRNDLIMAGLIEKSGTEPAEKQKRLEVDVYSSKKLGLLIWLIIKNMSLRNEVQQAKKKNDTEAAQTKTKELSDDNRHIYHLILSMIAKGKDAIYKSTLLKVFVDKLERRGLLDNFVNLLIDVCNSTNTIYDSSSLLSYVLDYSINVANNKSSFIDLWYESASELDPDSKRIFLYEIKLSTEGKVRSNTSYSKEYEKQWFANRANYNRIVLEGNCEKCKQPNVIMLSNEDHRYLIKANSIFNGQSESKRKFNCKFCNSKNSCVLSTF